MRQLNRCGRLGHSNQSRRCTFTAVFLLQQILFYSTNASAFTTTIGMAALRRAFKLDFPEAPNTSDSSDAWSVSEPNSSFEDEHDDRPSFKGGIEDILDSQGSSWGGFSSSVNSDHDSDGVSGGGCTAPHHSRHHDLFPSPPQHRPSRRRLLSEQLDAQADCRKSVAFPKSLVLVPSRPHPEASRDHSTGLATRRPSLRSMVKLPNLWPRDQVHPNSPRPNSPKMGQQQQRGLMHRPSCTALNKSKRPI